MTQNVSMIKEENKILYVVPGFGETPRMKGYREIIKSAKQNGYAVFPIKIDWQENKTINEYAKEAMKAIKETTASSFSVSILGFSFGAYIVALLSKTIEFEKIYFCSVSPYFKDDMEYIPQEAKDYFGKKFMKSLSNQNFPNTSRAKAFFFVGGSDWPLAIERMEKSYKLWKGRKEKFIISKVEHDISDPFYIKTIVSLFC